MKTINEKISITKKNNGKRIAITGGILVTSLMLAFSMPKKVEASPMPPTPTTNNDNKNYFDYQYAYIIKNSNPEEYDQVFRDYYFNTTVVINNQKYDIKELYIIELEDESIHLINANNPQEDLLTKETISNSLLNDCNFRNSTVFWNLYKDGFVKDNELTIDNNIKSYIDGWDSDCHEEVFELHASLEVGRRYKREFRGVK